MALDARVRYTKMVIVQSFTKIIREKPLNKITVKEICDMAEINRATFYKYYLDVYDLLDKIEEQFLEELSEILSSQKNETAKDVLTLIMVSFKAEQEKYEAIFSANGDVSFPQKVIEMCYDMDRTVMQIENKSLSKNQNEWLFRFIAQGCNGILNQWIAGGMREPISEVADFTEQLVKNVVSKL